METGGNNTTAGVVYWTPAPRRISPTSSLGSEEEDWEDEEDEEASAEKDEDFQSQMDENGIIGLGEVLEDTELAGDYDEGDVNGGCGTPWSAGGHSPGSPGGEDGSSMPLERATYDPNDLQDSETLSHTEPLGDDTLTHSMYDDVAGGMEVWTEDEELRQMQEEDERRFLIHRQSMEHLPERDKQLDMTEEENEGDERQEETGKKDEHTRISGSSATELESSNGFTEHSFDSGNSWRFSSRGSSPSDQLNLEANDGPIKQNRKSKSRNAIAPQSGNRTTTLPHLLHFSADELAEAGGIEAELFPDAGFTESLPESCSSRVSHAPKPHWPHGPEAGSAAVSPELGMARHQNMAGRGPVGGFQTNCKRPTPSPRKARQRSFEAAPSRIPSPNKAWVTSSTEAKYHTSPDRGLTTPIRTQISTPDLYDSRRTPLNYRTPDFSKVEPKVHFPKSGYTPPKSRNSPEKRSLPLERPLVFKSPADIAKEVLFSSPDEPQPPDMIGAPNSTVPHDFRCPQQATTLVQQLQEDYNRLLTKFAEAENTIDRLRLEAKVNLYSDPPKPSHLVQSGLIQEGSKVMTLNIPLAQRAEVGPNQLAGLSPARPSSATSTSSRRSLASQVGQHPTRTLIKQADTFLQKVQAFEDLLKSGKGKPFEQMTHLSQLFEGLNSLERGYLAARDEHRLLRCRGAEMGSFDPNRELEGFIFQCGMRVEDFKEQLEQVGQDQPVSQAPPSPPPQPTPLPTPTTAREPMPQPETPVWPVPGEAGVVGVEVSSASGESDGEDGGMVGDEEEEEEAAPPHFFLRPLDRENRLAEQDFDTLFDHNQSFKELTDQNLREGVTVSPGLGADVQPTGAGREEQRQRTGDVEVHSLRPARSSHQGSCKVPSPKPRTSKSNPPSPRANNQSPAFPAHHGRRRSEVRKSHSSSLTSLGESILSERRGSKLQPGTRRVLSQDGIISPETDSGFVGSEASRLTPAAVPSPLHQRGSASASVPLERNPGKHQGGAPVSGQTPAVSPSSSSSSSHRPPSSVHSDGSRLSAAGETRGPATTRAGGERERRGTSASSSRQNWAGQTRRRRAGSGTSEFGLDSESTHAVSEDGASYRPTPSPAAPYHHGDHLRVLGSSQLTSSNEAVRNLQTEVTKLKDRLDSLRTMATAPVTPPPAQRHYTHHGTSTPRIRSGQHWVDGGGEERRGRRMVEEPKGERTTRQTSKKRSASVPRQRQEPHTPAYSELDHSTPRSQFPRPFLVSPAVQGPCSHYNTPRRSRAQRGQHPGLSAGVTEPGDEPDRRGSVCPQCTTHHHEHSARPLGGNSKPIHTSSHSRCCPLCGQPEPYNNTSTEPACRSERESDPTHRSCCQSSHSTHRNVPGPPVLGSVPMVQCVPVCPATVLFYPSPVIKMDSYPEALRVPSNSSGGAPSGVRGRKEARGHTSSLTTNQRRSLSTSLDRAIRAARDMKHTSRRMARSLASGLHYQELLSQSCIY